MAAVSRLHGQILKITKAASRIFAKQLLLEFTRLNNRFAPLARRLADDPQELDDLVRDLLPEHGAKIKEIIRKNDVRVMRAIHTFQMDLLSIKKSNPLYASTRGSISSLASSLAKTASGEMLNTTQKVLERSVDLVAEDAEPDKGIAYAKERLKGGIAQRRSRNVADDQSHKAAQAILQAIGDVGQSAGEELWKTWMARRDTKVRHTHFIANGQTVRTNESFQVGNSILKFPGDPNGEAKETIGCRCSIRISKRKPKRAA